MNAMNFVLDAQSRMSAGLKAIKYLLDSSANRSAHVPIPRSRTSPAPFAIHTRTSPVFTSAIKPLRVLRVMEPGQQRSSVGRMVISGRMADVCAELDRLAAREAAMS